jgi:HEAT repeat protein
VKRTTISHSWLNILARLCIALSLASAVMAQDSTRPAPADTTDAPAFDALHATPAESTQEAWILLTSALQDIKHSDTRIQALAALGTMGSNARSGKMIVDAMKDSEVDVRTAAVLAAGQTKDRSLATAIRARLDDKEPQVAFAAAITLSKTGDRSGEDILMAVVDGDRKAGPGLVNGAMHTMNKDFHNPASIAKIGALQGASMLLGPFGFGITAYEYMRKNGGDQSRVTAIEELAKLKTNPIRRELVAALADKDPSVRAAAAKALGEYHDKSTAGALLNLLSDSKQPVRLTAAAAYIRSTGKASSVAKTTTR